MNIKGRYSSELFKKNNFDLLRLIAASQVAVTHGIEHLQVDALYPLAACLNFIPGVPIFFFLSGLLISAAWERDPDLKSFFGNRFYRIFPGLWLCVLLSVVVIALTAAMLNEDLPYRLLALWGIMQATFLPQWNPEFLDWFGIGVVNGSLWTIPVELSFYLFLPMVYALSNRLRLSINQIFAALLFMSLIVFHAWIVIIPASDFQLLISKLLGFTPIPWFWMFCFGVLAQRLMKILHPFIVNKAHIFLLFFAFVSLAGNILDTPILFGNSNEVGLINWLALCLLVLSFGYSSPWLSDKLLKRNDISYGIYIYHMPIFNCAITFGLVGNFGLLSGLLLTVVFALLSWHFLEKPFLRKRKTFLYSR